MYLQCEPRTSEEGAEWPLTWACSSMLPEGRHHGRPPSRSETDLLLALQRTLLEAIPKDLSRPWEDPLPEQGERHLAQELRGIGLGGYEVPEWKQQALGKVRLPAWHCDGEPLDETTSSVIGLCTLRAGSSLQHGQ